MQNARLTVPIRLSEQAIWEKLKDLSLAANYVPGVREVVFLSKERTGLGASRRVLPVGLDETVVRWEEGQRFVLRLHKGDRTSFFPFQKAFFEYAISREPTGVTLCMSYDPMVPAFLLKKAIMGS
ncbi:MAG: hypothetical protein R6W96_02175 [Clostridia bacterium]